LKTILIIAISFVLFVCPAYGQEEEYPHPELDWNTIETGHFLVHYHNGAERTAREVAAVAEHVYKPITDLYQHQPDQKVSFVIRDHDDYSNGAAYFYENRILLWAPSLDFELRGTHPWIQNVVTHEFTHIVQIQTAMKLSRKIPGIYLQWLGYESERRPDVLYGYPNVLVSYPLSAFVVPSWFAEGVAQYNHPDFQFDTWDSHRDMILRMYMLDGNPLSWDEMAVFGKTSLGNESSYNAGFSIVGFIAERYGLDKLRQISEELSSPLRVTIDGAIERVLGKTGQELYDEWKKEKTRIYQERAKSIRSDEHEGEIIEKEGFGNFYPAFSPDGSSIFYVSNRGEDYFSQSSIFRYDVKTKQRKKIVPGVRSTLSFSPDARFLYYSKLSFDNPHGSRVYDIYRFDLREEEETRLTFGLRAQNPKLSSDGKKFVFATGNDGTLNIGSCDVDGKNPRRLTSFSSGEQVYTPAWSPDSKQIAFGFSRTHKQMLATIDSTGSNLKIYPGPFDSRNPAYSSNGTTIYYSADEDGIFNVYALDGASGAKRRITNVLGGAFLPAVDSEGQIAFASYTSSGYKLAAIKDSSRGDNPKIPPIQASSQETARSVVSSEFSYSSIRDSASSRPYRSVYSSLTIIPLIRVDNYNVKSSGLDILKPGFYFATSDVLDKLSLFGGAAINRNFERDLFFIFEYRDKLPILFQLGLEPTLSLEIYNLSRKTSNSFVLGIIPITTDVTYDLLEFDASLRGPLFSELNNIKVGYTLSRYSAEIGSFKNPRLVPPIVPAFRSQYLIGNTFSLNIKHNGILPNLERDINPVGRTISFKYSMELNKFNPDGEFKQTDNGAYVPVFTRFDFHRLEAQWSEHLEFLLPKHTVTISARGGTILGPAVDSFFDFYAGGFAGMKGYPFYAIGGNAMAAVNATYRFPISTKLNFRFLQFNFTKLYASVFADVGNAWTGSVPDVNSWRKDVGAELRLEAFSFYAYPTRIFVSGAYGLDKFGRFFGTTNVTYGNEWRFYLGILFGFELNDMIPRLKY